MKREILAVFGIVLLYASASFADKETVLIYPKANTTCPEYTLTQTQNCRTHEKNVTCRKDSWPANKIVWQWHPDAGVSVPFKIVMKAGHERPFNDQAQCKEQRSEVTCKIKSGTGEPDGREYRYAVVVNAACKLDPRILVY